MATTGSERSTYSTAWQEWWQFNGDPYLRLRTLVSGLSSTTGGGTQIEARQGYGPTSGQIQATVVPALRAALMAADNTDVVRGAMIALARIGKSNELPGLTLDQTAKFYLKEDHQPSTESALIALGLRADASSVDLLLNLVRNNEAGQELRDDQSVDSRTRVFATYALGLLSRRADDPKLSAKIGRELTRCFVTDETATFEMHVAMMLSLGLAPDDECDGEIAVDLTSLSDKEAHLCRGTQIAALVDYFEDTERPYELRAHAAVPLARLALNASEPYKMAIAKVLQEPLESRSKEHPSVRHSCVVALGVLGDSDEDPTDQAIRETLFSSASRGKDLLQRLSMVSLAKVAARVGDSDNTGSGLRKVQKFLSKKLASGRGDIRSWAAMALSILGHDHNRETAEIPEGITNILRDSLNARSEDRAAASALAIGVLRDYDSYSSLLKHIGPKEAAHVRSYSALALGMIGAREAIEPLTKLVSEEDLSPMVLGSASIALRLLGHREAASTLLAQLDDLEETDDQIALISAAGVLGDSTSIELLIELMGDDERDDALRGSAALALGVLCDTRTEAWT
ncbi:MAG: HEAT repeat protein, partial [Planctomycetota bacterium]